MEITNSAMSQACS